MKSFDKENIELEGSNLIEASAGTGKTYSIAILVLRLLLEKGILIQEILLVTFTEAAASELKERTALFIRKALKEAAVSTEGLAEDKTIWRIVHRAIGLKSVNEVKSILNKALLDIDLASIQTIHSFCQGTLTEFAFETNQIFGSELIKTPEEISIRFLNEYWRSKIAVIPAELQNLFPDDFRGMLQKGTALVLSNHTFTGNCFKTDNCEEIENEQARIKEEEDQILIDYFDVRIDNMKSKIVEFEIQKKISGGKSQEKLALKKLDDYFVLEQYLRGTPKFNFDELFEEEIEFCKNHNKSKRNLTQEYINTLISNASIEIAEQVKDYLKANNLLTFDALIANLHAAKDEEKLKNVLRNKYKAIFIDEFQDTDKLQYEIFETVFQENPETVLFYIGDPKQSIYAFRKADLNTYFRAKEKVSSTWTMNVNFRSTDCYVEAMNDFFRESDDFSTFHFNTKEIEYYKVEASLNNRGKIGICNTEKEVFTPLQIRANYNNKNIIQSDLTNLVVKLLDGTHTIENRLIVPSDIGILVRSNADGRTIKRLLERKGVPAVVVDDSSIFKCNEANDINFVLNAILQPNKSTIDKALLTQLIGYKSEQLIAIDHDKILLLFRKYHQIWSKSGVYRMLHQFIVDFGIETKWTNDTEIGHRVLSNVFQLTELLQKISISQNFTPSKLKAFLQNSIQNSEKQEDAFTQRIERDEDAVKIATIHKSKGLQYNIVLLPNLDFTAKERGNFSNFKDENKAYLYTRNPIVNQSHADLFLEQEEQENRRLIYVALTRACYNSYVFINTSDKISSIKSFIDKLLKQKEVTHYLDLLNGLDNLISEETYAGVESSSETVSLAFPNTKPNDHNWNKMSYSFLAAPHKSHPTENNINYEEGYDRFIFKELEKGIHIGNMLHNVFEYLDFTDSKDWDKVIEISLQQFTASKKELYAPWMKAMIQHVLNSNIQIGADSIPLKAITNNQKVNELEFDFPIDATFDIKLLQGVFSPNDSRFIYTGFGEVKGMLTGFVDLFFEHQGKYYILDWKSNFLGDQLEHYHPDLLNDAMNESNYHLQYCIYTIAMKWYLESKIPSFDYETQFGGVIYLFLRGVREGSNMGVFTAKLAIEEVQKIEKIFNLEKITN